MKKIEILLPIYEIISLNKFKNAGVKLLELTCKMIQKKNKKKGCVPKNNIFIIQKFIEFSNMNWANQEILNYDYFIDLFLIRDLNDNDSLKLMNTILNKYKVDINKFKMWLYYGGEGNYKNLKDIFEKLSKYFLEKEDNISDLFFLFWDNPNKFLFLFIFILLQKKRK